MMDISKNIIDYLDSNEWYSVYEGEAMIHYKKLKHDTIYHLYITYFKDYNEYEVELGSGETQNDTELFQLRNIVSVLKRRDL